MKTYPKIILGLMTSSKLKLSQQKKTKSYKPKRKRSFSSNNNPSRRRSSPFKWWDRARPSRTLFRPQNSTVRSFPNNSERLYPKMMSWPIRFLNSAKIKSWHKLVMRTFRTNWTSSTRVWTPFLMQRTSKINSSLK